MKIEVLLVEDEKKIREQVVRVLTEKNSGILCPVSITRLNHPDELVSVKPKTDFDLCIVDGHFKGVELGSVLISNIKARWPRSLVVSLSNYPHDSGASLADVKVIKPQFKLEPSVLLTKIEKGLRQRQGMKLEQRGGFVELMRKQKELRLQEKKGVPPKDAADGKSTRLPKMTLLEILGSIKEIHGPFVEVVVESIHRMAKKLPDGSESSPASLFMRTSMFAQKGLLSLFTPFRYAVWEEKGRLIAEVFPRKRPEGTLLPDDPSLESLLKIQQRQQRICRSRA